MKLIPSSPAEDLAEMRRLWKAQLANSLPSARTVEVFRPGATSELLTGIDSISGEGPVAGFTLDLHRVWNPFTR